MTRATYQVIVRWGVGPIGNITTFDAVYGVPPYLTAYDDISTMVDSMTFRRGRTDPAGAVAASTYTFQLRDPDGWFVPGNAASPLIGLALDGFGNLLPYRTIRVQAFNPTTPITKAYGYITRITPDPATRTATIEASDALHRLALELDQTFVIKADGFTEATYSLILDLLTTRFGGDYSYAYSAAGNVVGASPGITATAGDVPLTLIGDLLAADRGLFYVRADGTMQYLDRHWHDRSPRHAAQSTIADVEIRRLATGVDIATVFNAATVTGLGDLVAAPTGAPILTSPAATSPATSDLPAGTYTLAYSYVTGNGETALSPTATVTTIANDVIVAGVATFPLPSGVTAVNWYMSVTTGSTSLRLFRNASGTLEDDFGLEAVSTFPAANAALPLTTGTARNPVAQTVTDATSKARFDPRPLPALTSPYLPTNADALNTARWLVAGRKDVASLAYAANLDGDASANVLAAILSRDLHDRVNLTALGVGSADYYIVGSQETIENTRRHTATWLLQRRRVQDVAGIVGYSRVGQCAVGYTVV